MLDQRMSNQGIKEKDKLDVLHPRRQPNESPTKLDETDDKEEDVVDEDVVDLHSLMLSAWRESALEFSLSPDYNTLQPYEGSG